MLPVAPPGDRVTREEEARREVASHEIEVVQHGDDRAPFPVPPAHDRQQIDRRS